MPNITGIPMEHQYGNVARGSDFGAVDEKSMQRLPIRCWYLDILKVGNTKLAWFRDICARIYGDVARVDKFTKCRLAFFFSFKFFSETTGSSQGK